MITCKHCGSELVLGRFDRLVHYVSQSRLCDPDNMASTLSAEAQVSR